MSGWTVVAAMGFADAVLWAALAQYRPAPIPERLARYCGGPSRPLRSAFHASGDASGDGTRPRSVRAADLRALRKALPDALDTLAICLRAGLGLHAAVAEYAETATGVARDVFRGYLAELGVGRPPDEALADLAVRYPLDEVAAVAAAVAQSLRLGAPLAEAFEAQAGHCRRLTLHAAREAAQKLSTQLVLPLIAFIFPVVFIIGLGPVALKIARLVGLMR